MSLYKGGFDMKKVTLLGDSIRQIGYGLKVPELLGSGYSVYQPEDNCRFAKYTLRGVLREWKNDIKGSDIIHWNNGLWDICDLGDGVFTSEGEYVENMLRVARLLKQLGKVVIFATTTPVNPKHEFNKNSTIVRYNELIVPELKKLGIIINDLYTPVAADIEKYISDDLIHLSEEGVDLCAGMVADIIKSNT